MAAIPVSLVSVVLAATVGAEASVGTLSPGAQPAGLASHSVAWTGSHFLTVFTEARNGVSRSLYGVRIGPDGTKPDPYSFLVARGFSNLGRPSVACGGGVCVVAYVRTAGGDDDVLFTRVTPAGAPLDPDGLPLATGAGQQGSPRVLFDGTDFVVFFTDDRATPGNAQLMAARVSTAMSPPTVSPQNGAPLGLGGLSVRDCAASFDGTQYVLAWADFRGMRWAPYAARLTPALAPLDPLGIALAPSAEDAAQLAVATVDGVSLVAWSAASGTLGVRNIDRVRLSSAGALLDATPVPVGTVGRSRIAPDVIAREGGFELVFVDRTQSQARRARVTTAGDVTLQDQPIAYSSWELRQARTVFANGASFTTAAAESQLQHELITDAGSAWSGRFADGTARQFGARSVWTGAGWVVAWLDWEANFTRLMTAPVDADGGVGSATELFRDYFIDDLGLAWRGPEGLLVFELYGRVAAFRVDAQGRPLDAQPLRVSNLDRASQPVVAAGADDYLVTWSDDRLTQYQDDVFAARVSPGGAVAPANGAPLVVRPWRQQRTAVGWDGARFVVAWAEDAQLRVTSVEGSALPPATDAGVVISTSLNGRPVLAGGPGGALLAWSDTAAGDADVRVLRLGPGPLAGETPVTVVSAPGVQERVAVSGDATGYLLSWEDLARAPPQRDVHALKLGPDLAPVEPAFTLSTGTNHDLPVSALDGRGRALVTYGRYTESPPVTSFRVYARTLGVPSPNGARCRVGADCASTFCVDGVCCESACGGGALDCQACARSSGGGTDGVCGAANVGFTCRPAMSVCDAAETCDGTSLACPADVVAPNGLTCGFGTCFAGACLLADAGELGELDGGATGGGLAFTSTPRASGTCNSGWRYEPTTNAPGTVAWAVRGVDGEALPAALFQNPATGAVFWQPAEAGAFAFEVIASAGGQTARQRVEVAVTCEPYQVACGCDAAGGALAVLGLLMLARRPSAWGKPRRNTDT